MKTVNQTGFSPANISNPIFGIKMLMGPVPFKIMWFREVLKNALEATTTYIANNTSLKVPTQIKVRGIKLEGLQDHFEFTMPKISVLNYGGMSYEELKELPNVFCDSEKVKDFLANFGAGVKITCTKFSDLLFISKKGKLVHMIKIGLNEAGELGSYGTPTDVTTWAYDEADVRGYDMEHDWTDVIILGKQVDQNTVTHTFDPRVETEVDYQMIRLAFQRFWDLPANIEVSFAQGTNSGGKKSGNVIMKTLNQVVGISTAKFPHLGAFDIVVKVGAVKVLLRYDPKRIDFADDFYSRFLKYPDNEKRQWLAIRNSETGFKVQDELPVGEELEQMVKSTKYVRKGAEQPLSSYSLNRLGIPDNSANFSALVWGKPGEQEMYEIVQNGTWKAIASKLGIFADYNQFKIFVLLPYSEYKPSLCRSKLYDKSTDITESYGNIDADLDYKDFIPVIKEALEKPEAHDFMEKVKAHNKLNVSADCDAIMDEMIKDIDFDPFTQDGQKKVNDPYKKGTKGGKQTGKNKKVMPEGITFSNTTLTCPNCRRQTPKKITPMPKGQKTCTVCGYTRKDAALSGGGTKNISIKATTPKPEFREDLTLAEHWARSTQESETRDIIFVNPEHDAVKRLVKGLYKDRPDAGNLPQTTRDQIKLDAFEILKASTGVQYMIMKGEMQNSIYYDAKLFDAWTDPAQYTARAKFDNLALKILDKKYMDVYYKQAKVNKKVA